MKFTDHPDDQAARIELTNRLAVLRKRARLSREAVCIAAGLGGGRVSLIERHPELTIRFRTYTAISNVIGWRFLPVAVGDMFDETPAVQPILDRDEFVQYAEWQRIVETRHRTIRAEVVAERMGVGTTTVFKLEQLDRDDPSVAVMQSYTRAIGGYLNLALVTFEDAVAA